MNELQLKRKLWDLGHFNNPNIATSVSNAEEAERVNLTSPEFKAAIRSFQDFMKKDFDRFAIEEHGREGVPDGDIGPATEKLLVMPRCGFPDYPVGALASKAEANWPTACRGNLTFGLAFDRAPGMSSEDTLRAFIGAINNWNYALDDLTGTVQRGKSGAKIWAGLGRLSGSTLAWSYLARNSCSVILEQRYDNDRTWNLNFLSTVASHEIGHAYGLSHSRDGSALMYPSIHQRSLARRGYPNNTDLSQARSLGYKLSGSEPPSLENQYRPMPHDPDEPDDPPTSPDGVVLRGTTTVEIDGKVVGSFIFVPKPGV